MADSQAKTAWERDNVVKLTIKINRNQDPVLYELLTKAANKSGLVRDLIQKGMEASNQDAIISKVFAEAQK